MSAAATAMAAGLSAGARRFVVQLELTNKTRASEQLASLGPASGKLFFKGRLALAAQAPASFLPFVWRCGGREGAGPGRGGLGRTRVPMASPLGARARLTRLAAHT